MQQGGPQFVPNGIQTGGTGAFGQQTYSYPAQHPENPLYMQGLAQGAQPQTYQQAAPVAPVQAPGYTPASGYQQAAPQTPQQAYARQLTGIARVLEQLLPVYQMLISVLQDAAQPTGQEQPGVGPLLDALKEGAFHHYASLGAIRRFLLGEMSGEVFSALARSVYQLDRLHRDIRPRLEQVAAHAQPELRPTLAGLSQATAQADSLVAQAVSAVKTTVGQSAWDQATTTAR